MLADRALVQISPASRRIVFRQSLGPRRPLAASGRFLALSDDGRRLFVLTPSAPGTGQEVRIFDPTSLRLLERVSLERRFIFRVIAVGQSGRLYLFGNRPRGRGAEDAVIAVLDADGREKQIATVRGAAGHDWWVFDGTVSPDESRLYVSYHGGCGPENAKLCTSGADWIDVTEDRLMRCERRSLPGNGCLVRVHGGVKALDSGVLAATGAGRILQISDEGEVVATLRTRLAGNHLMELAVDVQRDRAYAVGQCYYTGGVSVIELMTGRTELLSPDVCGDRIAVGADMIAVAEQQQASALGIPSRIALLDLRTGSARYASVPVEAVDLLVFSPS